MKYCPIPYIVLLIAMCLFANSVSFAQSPANDQLANAILLDPYANISCSTVSYTNVGATTEPNEPSPSCFGNNIKSVWFKVGRPQNGATLKVSTDFSGFTNANTEIAAYVVTNNNRFDFGNLLQIECRQDNGIIEPNNASIGIRNFIFNFYIF